ncbi:MAG: DNA integrity scanning protein DisA nucleotide-binding domain protein [Desulfobacteraceae bacterium]|jgi:hypothetical protein|nr:DNA integrity scanning protein DisA nucleotide-binding domain protein [Desulfobacteraceae bacterium]
MKDACLSSIESYFICKCIGETIDGLRDGLCRFSGPSRAALIYALDPDEPMKICDPQNLLHGHEPKFKELFLDTEDWRSYRVSEGNKRKFGHMRPLQNLGLAGLISFGGRSGPVFYQMWFTEHHPDMCCTHITERWLEHAAWRFSHDVANGEELYTGISGSFLSEYATHAVRDYLIDVMNVELGWDTELRIFPILEAVLGISRTPEEGQHPWGELLFVEPKALDRLCWIARFPPLEQPRLENYKHVRKLLLTVEGSERKLVSDGQAILGVASGSPSAFCLAAEFFGRYGFLKVHEERICSFSDGSFRSTTYRAKLVQVEEALLEADLDPNEGSELFKIVSSLVHHAEINRFGCTIVLDLNPEPIQLSGQTLAEPLDLQRPENLELAQAMAKVDGALHVGQDLKLHGFACLLDGRSYAGEDRSRGARFNSALRFTAERANILVVVVSSDRPVSIIQEGVDVSALCAWKPHASSLASPRTLESWISRMNGN